MVKMLRHAMMAAVAAVALFTSGCSVDDDESVNVITAYVSVNKAQDGTIFLVADNDVILKPINADLLSSWLPNVKRAFISFSIEGSPTMTAQDMKAGATYSVKIDNTSGLNGEIPTFLPSVDVTSEEYLNAGQDSIESTGKHIFSIDEGMVPYAANGYVNIAPTFPYSAKAPVLFMLYYDGENCVDLQKGTVSVSLYFNNHTDYAEYSNANLISLLIPEEIGDKLIEAGYDEADKISVKLTAKESLGAKTVVMETTVGDLFR